ncbi:hypothetical protein AKJ09_07299 [Labilithrix luteola]|uniref:Uncharacterized protein n=2 Tax=Labilithrix luteola TaxID=1391654 RepID=A0A0K1Q478_9BACT|nr:hypothetical protein AKJ09_07299 [Labilithrix luteola]
MLRHPLERRIYVGCVILNFVLLGLGILTVVITADVLEAHPGLGRLVGHLKYLVIAAMIGLPLAPLTRHLSLFTARGNAVRISGDQFPELHAIVAEHCRRLEMNERPELYVSVTADAMVSVYSAVGSPSCVLLSEEFFDPEWRKNLDAMSFAIGWGLGAIRLGHTRFLSDVLTAYIVHVPFLRNPVSLVRTYSRDRCAAFVAPEGVRGLVLQAAGKDVLAAMDPASFVEQAMQFDGLWAKLSQLRRPTPHVLVRIKRLYETGFFDLEHDRTRFAASRGTPIP